MVPILPRLYRLALLLGSIFFLFPVSPVRGQSQPPEFRGMWADAWSTDLWTAGGISQMVSDLRAGNMNAVVAQIRRRGDALYTSHYEPKCKDISAGFDPLADLIAKAHNTNNGPRLEVHGWLVTYHIWQGTTPPAATNHPFNLHPDWLLKDVSGNTLIGNEYTFDPGHPDVQRHTFNVCMDIITNYDIDGINFDYIRYSGTSEGYNDVTVARFKRIFNRTGVPATGDATWKQFRRDQITGLLRKIYLNAIALRPNIKVSCDTITWDPAPTSDATWYSTSAAWNSVFQDWRGWAEEGIMDMGISMNYFRHTVPAHALDYTNWSNFAKDRRFNRHTVVGPGIYLNSVNNSILQMRQPRQATVAGHKADGVCGYDYKVTNTNGISRATFLNALVQPSIYDPEPTPIFAEAVPVPDMPWKSAPTRGHLMGFVYGDTTTNPVDAAVVTLTGPLTRAQTNDATGFYGFVDLPPGNYTVSAAFGGYNPASASVTVTAGVVGSRDLLLLTNRAPVIVTQPQSQTVVQGSNATFSVTVTGEAPLAYQWRYYATNLSGATGSSLALSAVSSNQAGPYDVVVTNAFGAVTSSPALLSIALPPTSPMVPLWSLAAGTRPYLTVNSLPNERGMAYNPMSRRLLVVSRSGPHIYVLDGDTGDDLHELGLTGVTGGYSSSYYLLMADAGDDGAVYAANLTLSAATVPFKIYRWAGDDPGTAPSVAYSGDPAPGYVQRWGDTFDVRGAGTNTQILIASRAANLVVVFTTSNGTTFVPHPITVADAAGSSMGLGIAFGAGNAFWGKASGSPLRKVAFDLAAGTGTSLGVYTDPPVPATVAPIGVSADLNLLAGINVASPNRLQIYWLVPPDRVPALVCTNAFPTDNDNSQTGTGAVDFGNGRLYALDSNNGLMAVQVYRPVVLGSPAAAGSFVQFSVTGNPGAYVVQAATNLSTPSWQDRASLLSTNGSFFWNDTRSNASKLYRTRWQP